MNIHLFRFDLKEFLNESYTVNAYIDEYEKGQEPKRARTIRLGENIRSLNDVPEEHRKYFRETKQVPEGKNEIDPEMKANILVNVPRYYVLGLELLKAEKAK